MMISTVLDIFKTLFYELVDFYESKYNRDPSHFVRYEYIHEQELLIPIDGNVKLPKYIVYLSEIPVVKRLSEIKQLAHTYIFLPGATHSRYEHSIGVMSKARKIFTQLRNEGKIEAHNDWNIIVDLATFLHDIGHPSWGHALDGILGTVIEIIEGMCKCILPPVKLDIVIATYLIRENEQLSRALTVIAKNELSNSLIKQNLHDIITQIILEEEQPLFDVVRQNSEVRRLVHIITTILGSYRCRGGVNVDRLDWLIRDHHHTALNKKLPSEIEENFEKLRLRIEKGNINIEIMNYEYTGIGDKEFTELLSKVREDVYKHVYESLPRAFADSLLTRLAYSVIRLVHEIGSRIAGMSVIARAVLGYLLLPDFVMIDYTRRFLLASKSFNIFSIIEPTSELRYSVRSANLLDLLGKLTFLMKELSRESIAVQKFSPDIGVGFRVVKLPAIDTTIVLLDAYTLAEIISRIQKQLEQLGLDPTNILTKVYQYIIIAARMNPIKGMEAIKLEEDLIELSKEIYILPNYYAFRKIDDKYFRECHKRVGTIDDLCEYLKTYERSEVVMFITIREIGIDTKRVFERTFRNILNIFTDKLRS